MADGRDPMTRAGSRSRRASVGAILALAFILAIAFASSAQGYVYWTNAHSIGRADQDGANVNQNFISNPGDELVPIGVAVDSQHVYFTDLGGLDPQTGMPRPSTIARANLDGTNLDRKFIQADDPWGIAVDSQHVYWTNREPRTIARADLDGMNVDPSLFSTGFVGSDNPYGVAVDSKHIYFTIPARGWLGRADLDGTHVEGNFISPSPRYGVAVDAHHIYWTTNGSIGRANLDGTHVDDNFITGLDYVNGVAVDSHHVYWTTFVNGKIGRAKLDGSNVDRGFITGADRPYSVTVDSAGPGGGGPGRQIVGSVDPHRATLDDRTCFRFHARDESGKRLRNVKVRFGGKHHRTNRRGRTKICKTFAKPGARHAHLTKGPFDPDKLRVKVRG
jgi:virginiamycin B lyase